MLQNLRKHAQGWIAFIIMGLLCFAFALWGVQYYLESRNHADTVAKVGNVKISNRQLNVAYERLKRQQSLRLGKVISLSSTQQLQLKRQALEATIEKQMLFQAALKAGLQVSSDQLNAIIMEMPQFQENGRFSVSRFQRILSALIFSQSEFLENLRKAMLIMQWEMGILNSAFALPNEVNKMARLVNEKRSFQYLLIPESRFYSQVKISPDDVTRYYNTYKKKFMQPQQVSIAYIKLSADQVKKQYHVNESDLKNYYEDNIEKYSSQKQWKVASILVKVAPNADKKAIEQAKAKINNIAKQLKAGAEFSKFLGKTSNWFTRSERSPVFVQIVSQLKPGETSSPYRSQEGFNIVKLLAVKRPIIKPFSEVKEKVAKAYREQKLQQMFSDDMDKLSELTYTNPDTLEVAAKALGLKVQKTGLFTKKGKKRGIISNPKIVNAAFSEDVLEQGNNSDVIQLDDNTAVVLRIKENIPEKAKPLAEVQESIKNTLRHQKAEVLAEKLGKTIIAALKQNSQPADIAKNYQLTWHHANQVTRQQAGIDAQILQAAFTLSTGKNPITGINLTDGNYAILDVSSIVPGQFNRLSKQEQQVLTNETATQWGKLDYDLYVEGVKKKTKVEIYDKSFS